MYDSKIGRWLSTDPARQFHSPYVGMGNSPINRFDPNGGEDGDPRVVNMGRGDAVLLNDVTVEGRLTWYDKLWRGFKKVDDYLNSAPGIEFMNSPGKGGTPLIDGRPGPAEFIMMDPTSGIVVFNKINGRTFKWDGRTPIPKSEWDEIYKTLKFGVGVISKTKGINGAIENTIKGVNSIIKRQNMNYHFIWGKDSLKPRYLDGNKGTIFLDSVPIDSKWDTVPVNKVRGIEGWGDTGEFYDYITK